MVCKEDDPVPAATPRVSGGWGKTYRKRLDFLKDEVGFSLRRGVTFAAPEIDTPTNSATLAKAPKEGLRNLILNKVAGFGGGGD